VKFGLYVTRNLSFIVFWFYFSELKSRCGKNGNIFS
jgi:hypothetical protein